MSQKMFKNELMVCPDINSFMHLFSVKLSSFQRIYFPLFKEFIDVQMKTKIAGKTVEHLCDTSSI